MGDLDPHVVSEDFLHLYIPLPGRINKFLNIVHEPDPRGKGQGFQGLGCRRVNEFLYIVHKPGPRGKGQGDARKGSPQLCFNASLISEPRRVT